jgi:hypothetical protein
MFALGFPMGEPRSGGCGSVTMVTSLPLIRNAE